MLKIFGCILDLDQTARVQTSCRPNDIRWARKLSRSTIHMSERRVAWRRCQNVLSLTDALRDRCQHLLISRAQKQALTIHVSLQTCAKTSAWRWTRDRRTTYPTSQHLSQKPIRSCGVYWPTPSRTADRSCTWWLQRLKQLWWQFDILPRYLILVITDGSWL